MKTTDPVSDALRAAIASNDSVELRVALARHLLRRGAADQALVELDAALAIDPQSQDALTAVAEATAMIEGAPATDRNPIALTEPGGNAPEEPGETAPLSAEPSVPARQQPRLRLAVKDGRTLTLPGPDEHALPRLDDVGGLDDVKLRLERAFLLPLRRPDVYRKFGKQAGGGFILYGPPGCGKTYIARALAGELGARFVSIGLSDVLDMWLGESERKLHELFENARRTAPTLIFFDEVDALAQRRTNLRHSAGRNVVNQFLAELDGVGGNNANVFVLGATNHPWDVDPAIRRPGRFECMIFVPPPDQPARERILASHLTGRLTAAQLDLGTIARRTEGFSGADLRKVVDLATDLAIERTLAEEGMEHPIDAAMLEAAVESSKTSTRPWFETARNYVLYANEGGTYDDLLVYMRRHHLA